jgi:Spy/CpxP family protein refolding chaperone
MRIAAALAFIASVLVMTPEAVSAMPLTLGDHAALSRHMSTTVMQVAHRHA